MQQASLSVSARSCQLLPVSRPFFSGFSKGVIRTGNLLSRKRTVERTVFRNPNDMSPVLFRPQPNRAGFPVMPVFYHAAAASSNAARINQQVAVSHSFSGCIFSCFGT